MKEKPILGRSGTIFERHFSPRTLAEMWGFSEDTSQEDLDAYRRGRGVNTLTWSVEGRGNAVR